MSVLDVSQSGVTVEVSTEYASTEGFSSTDDTTTLHGFLLASMMVVVPAGEYVTISIVRGALTIPLLDVAYSGCYFAGDNIPILPGDALRVVSGSVQSGDRELVVRGIRYA